MWRKYMNLQDILLASWYKLYVWLLGWLLKLKMAGFVKKGLK